MKILLVAAARPNFVKIAPLMSALSDVPGCEPVLVHTGQHYDPAMSDVFFRDLGIPLPSYTLGVGSGSHAEQTARVMLAFEPVLEAEQPDWLAVVGDVNATLACALCAVKQGTRVAHVEAGLRSHDWSMPEEINRRVTDSVSSLLFTPSSDASVNLEKEGIPEDRIYMVGNIMVDTLRQHERSIRALHACKRYDFSPGNYALVTLHRPNNVDDPEQLHRLMHLIACVQERLPLLFPTHPRTRSRLEKWGIDIPAGVRHCPPLGYLDFLSVTSDARLVLTDSGGVQEETTVLGVSCLTLRKNTERPVTVANGTNFVTGTETDAVLAAVDNVLNTGRTPHRLPTFWDGKTAARIARTFQRFNT